MGFATHFVYDKNVRINTDATYGWAVPNHTNIAYKIADNGWLQPQLADRLAKVLWCFGCLLFMGFIHYGINNAEHLTDVFVDNGDWFYLETITSTVMVLTMWMAVYFLLFQRLDWFGNVPWFPYFNTIMVIAYYITMSLCTVVFVLFIIPTTIAMIADMAKSTIRWLFDK